MEPLGYRGARGTPKPGMAWQQCKSHLHELHGGFFTVARPGEMWYSMLAAE